MPRKKQRKPDYSKAPIESQRRMGRYIPPQQQTKHHPLVKPFVRLEKQIWEPLLAWANNQALFDLLGVVGNIGIIVAVVAYVGSEKQRREAEISNAWQTITSAYGQSGSGGRIQALEFLNASPGANWRRKFPWFCAPHPLCTWERESLAGINLGAVSKTPHVYLAGIQLPEADLVGANFQGANLKGANLQKASLEGANLQGVYLVGANLQEADLARANLQEASLGHTNLDKVNLEGANLQGAYLGQINLDKVNLEGANLQGAYLVGANLQEADLKGANLQGASLWGTSLQGASLWGANLQGINLDRANLQGAIYTDEQTSASLCEAIFVEPPCPTLFPEGFDPEAAGMKLDV